MKICPNMAVFVMRPQNFVTICEFVTCAFFIVAIHVSCRSPDVWVKLNICVSYYIYFSINQWVLALNAELEVQRIN